MENPAIVLGVELMDRDHLRIERMFAAAANASERDLPALRKDITAELAAHFAREEEFMRERDYPGLHCHLAQHRILIAEMARGGDSNSAAADLRRLLAVVLPQLVLSHVGTMDRMIVHFLNGDLNQTDFNSLRLPVPEQVT